MTPSLLLVSSLPPLPARPASPALPASSASPAGPQVPFERAVADLSSADAGTRLRAVELLERAGYPEAAAPLAARITDPQDEVQLEAIAAELNIFLAEKIVPRKRVGLVIEVRTPIAAEPIFAAGPLAIGGAPVPTAVLTALRAATRDDNPRVGLEALYALGALGGAATGEARNDLLRASGPELAALIGSPDPAWRYAAVRVLGRLFAPRAGDEATAPLVGDAVITALNDKEAGVKLVAMQALGAMRYARAVRALTDLFHYYREGPLAEAALDALARIAHPSTAPIFTAQLASKRAALRRIAVEGLARIGGGGTLGAIQAALATERADSVALAGAFAAAMLSDAPLDRIAEALTRPTLHDQAERYLVELAPGRTSRLAVHLQDPNAAIRADLVDALGLSGDAAAIPLVQPLTADRDPKVARAATMAIARLRQDAL